MPTITLKQIPVKLHRALKARAAANKRSLNQEALVCLAGVVSPPVLDVKQLNAAAREARERLKLQVTQQDLDRARREGRA